ncbi:neurotrypsin-like isoform X2 [Macrobrachium nipponense]|uniref:neurotrypsin-like isoform X2 n=1 Tax=Macrobrachium nipponense TaxID=159736 RepID=UPI0030C89D4D
MDLGLRWSLLVLVFHLSFNLPVQSQRPLLDRKVAAVQLVGGESPTEGNILVTSEAGGEGRPLCDDFFGMTEANTVCRALGYPGALRFTRRNFYGGHTQRWTPDDWKDMYVLECPEETGNDNVDLTSCTLNSNTQYCTGAEVICRNLGYGSGMSIPYTRAYFGEAAADIGVDNLECTGEENSLSSCPGFLWGESDCAHAEDAGVFCHDGTLSVQLVEGSTPGSGRVEVSSSTLPSPASICDDGFDDLDAQVICRMLGYAGKDAVALRDSHFGPPTGEVWNIILDCVGSEATIQDCRIRIANRTCTQQHTASVACVRGTFVDDLLSRVLPSDCGKPLDASEQFLTGLGKVRGGRISSRTDTSKNAEPS